MKIKVNLYSSPFRCLYKQLFGLQNHLLSYFIIEFYTQQRDFPLANSPKLRVSRRNVGNESILPFWHSRMGSLSCNQQSYGPFFISLIDISRRLGAYGFCPVCFCLLTKNFSIGPNF